MAEPLDYVRAWDFGTGSGSSEPSVTADSDNLALQGGTWVTTALPGLDAVGYQFSRATSGRAQTLITGGDLFGTSEEYTVAVRAIIDPDERVQSWLASLQEGTSTADTTGQIQPWEDGRVWAGHQVAGEWEEVAAVKALIAADPDAPHWWTVTANDNGDGTVQVRLWLDGVQVASSQKTANADSNNIDRVAFANVYNGGTSLGCNCTIFATRIFDRGLTEAEVPELGVAPGGANTDPVCVTDGDQTVNEGAVVTVDLTGSADQETAFADLVFDVTVVDADGTGLVAGNIDLATEHGYAVFTAPAVAADAEIVLEFDVDDGDGGTDTAPQITITVEPQAADLFPEVVLPIDVELLLDGVWTSIVTPTNYVQRRDQGILIDSGRQDEASQVTAATCSLTLDNRDGRFSPRNPLGAYYGQIGRNTQLRVKVLRSNEYFRFWGEVSNWPPDWDPTGSDVYVEIEAAGILRRLEQSKDPVQSVLYREILANVPDLVAYWPCQIDAGPKRRRVTSALEDGHYARVTTAAKPNWASYDGFAASAPILVINDAEIVGDVNFYTYQSGKANLQFGFLLNITSGPDGEALVVCTTSGLAESWQVRYETANGGQLRLRMFDNSGSSLLDSGALQSGIDGQDLLVLVQLSRAKNETAINWTVYTFVPGGDPDGVSRSGRVATTSGLGRAERIILNPTGGHESAALGQVFVQSQISSPSAIVEALAAYEGERAGRRLERLCAENDIPFVSIGDLDATARMGPQRVDSVLNLIHECADADAGMLYEPRDALALGYRTLRSLENQDPAITVAYDSGKFAEVPKPVEDDQRTRNDVRADAPDGATARYVVRSGPLSVHAPPDGVGRYEDPITRNVDEGRLRSHAGWWAHLGTVDEARYPSVAFMLQNPAAVADMPFTHAVLAARQGDRLAITDMPAWVPPDDVSQLIEGIARERIANYEHEIEFHTSPESPYRVALYDSARYGIEDATTTASFVAGTDTSMSVAVAGETLWTTKAASFPFDIFVAGVRLTVTNISGSSSPQTFTITQTPVNGVVKTIPAGSEVRLFQPAYYALT